MLREALSLDRLRRLPPGEAAAYLVALGDAGLAPTEEAILAHWLAADPAHQQAFDSARRGWGVFDDAGDDEIIAAMRAHARTPRRSAPRWAPAAGAIAAVFVAVIALTVMLRPELAPWGPGPQHPAADNAVNYASNRGEIREVRLADGTLMTLDADSTAIVRFSDKRRSVRLSEGRAYFDVAADPGRPFAVAAADRQVVALGTRFDVNLQGDALVVTLLEGRVAVGSAAGDLPEFRLAPGQQFEERQGKALVRTLGPRGADAVAWRTGIVRFDDQSLAEAVAVMNRYAETPIVIRDPGVAALRISGQFRANQTDRFVETVAELHGLRVERSARALELSPPE